MSVCGIINYSEFLVCVSGGLVVDERVRKVFQALEQAGYEAYVVGGAVRDMIMGRDLHDYDVTTSARP